ncbi:hypothetical protein [Roseibium aggregatum]|uniref:hypothetical protein n=1 Tax=Roseibium aggregatum TaxID=187304 RepID=UPI001E3CFA04|nr:hypothetical protein [Roseibium aggregatum]UES43659.1 hypothetical protein GFK90_07655 [Roseibium aggregatum]
MMRRKAIFATLIGTASISLYPSISYAWDPVRDLTGKPIHEHGEKLGREIGNGLGDAGREIDKIGQKTIKEIGNAGEDLRILVEEGKCGGDVCDALDAVVVFTEESVIDTGKSLEQAAKRIEEGKFVDAIWHLGTDPLNNVQENAAEAAARSSVLRAVGQVAAGAYGGPAGAAAYAAWLAYNMTGGNLEMALKAGIIAGATAYAMSEISGMDGVDVIEDVAIDEVIQRAVLSGAVSGMAVAAAGGDETDIQNAITAGITMAVIRDGYKELTTTNLEDNLKASTGEPYCLGADPNSGLDCLPPDDAYVRTSDGKISYRDGKPEIDVTRLDAQRPHVGMFATNPDDPIYAGTETSDFMVGVSKIPGMNAMAVGHDIFDIRFNRIGDIPLDETTMAALEMGVRVGTIAPSVVVTFEGAGYRVHEMIRNEMAESGRRHEVGHGVSGPDSSAGQSNSDPTPVEPAGPVSPSGQASAPGPVHEIRNLVCRGSQSEFAVLMEMHIDPLAAGPGGRICSIERLKDSSWQHLWHAHNQTAFCIRKFNELAIRSVEQGNRCAFNVGLRYGNGDTLNGSAPELAEVGSTVN